MTQTCTKCGGSIQFRVIDGRRVPLHISGECHDTALVDSHLTVKRSEESDCRKTRCPTCRAEVFFLRHNGGSVWIEPPLGPPWDIHPCFLSKQTEPKVTYVSAEVFSALGSHKGLRIGVVQSTEIGDNRGPTILRIAVGRTENLCIVVKGGADWLAGKLVGIVPFVRSLHPLEDPSISFQIMGTLSGPSEMTGKGTGLNAPMSEPEVFKVQIEMQHGMLMPLQFRVLLKHRRDQLSGKWKLTELLALIPFLTGREFDRAVHAAAVAVLEAAAANGDCSAAATLAKLLPRVKRERLAKWFRTYAPISLDLTRKERKVYIVKTDAGLKHPFRIDLAKVTAI